VTTVREILIAQGPTGANTVAIEQLVASGALPNPVGVTSSGIASAIMAKVSGALEIEISDVIADAWRISSSLRQAARESRAAPGVYRTATLAECSIPWENIIELDVNIDAVTAVSMTFTAGLEFTITALGAIFLNGDITGFTSGDVTITGRLIGRFRPVQITLTLAEARKSLPIGAEFMNKGVPLEV
jgi:hypothetical protein